MRMHELFLAVAIALAPAAAHAGDTQDRYRASYAHESKGQYAKALADIDGLSKGERKRYIYHLRRGWLLYLLGRHWDAIESYRAAIKLEPRAVEARLGLMLPEMALLLWMDALETGQGVLELDPLNYLANSRMAWANYSLGRFDKAEALYRKLLKAYPSDTEMRTGLGWSLLKQGRYGTAQTEFEAVLRISPDYTVAKKGLAAAKDAAG